MRGGAIIFLSPKTGSSAKVTSIVN
jgi:hypothetical protein